MTAYLVWSATEPRSSARCVLADSEPSEPQAADTLLRHGIRVALVARPNAIPREYSLIRGRVERGVQL